MSGKFRKIQALFWSVTVKLAKGKNKFDKEVIEVKYLRLDKDELRELLARYQIDKDLPANEANDIHAALMDEIIDNYIVDWKIDDEDGKPLEFSAENLAMVMSHPDYNSAIITGFWNFQNGGALKN